MNIFYLDPDVELCAQYHCNKHVNKMILESAQMIFTAAHIMEIPDPLYKKTHTNHPSSKWVRESRNNLKWLIRLMKSLNDVSKQRSGRQHDHLSYIKVVNYEHLNKLIDSLPDVPFTPPPQCMPVIYHDDCTVTAYRKYYVNDKKEIAKWPSDSIPFWWTYDALIVKPSDLDSSE